MLLSLLLLLYRSSFKLFAKTQRRTALASFASEHKSCYDSPGNVCLCMCSVFLHPRAIIKTGREREKDTPATEFSITSFLALGYQRTYNH
ncbi:hypothetical protein IWX92DRAFT_43583 [Phyllosticta citricarpa]